MELHGYTNFFLLWRINVNFAVLLERCSLKKIIERLDPDDYCVLSGFNSFAVRHGVPNSLKGPTGFDSETNGNVSMSSAGEQLVNLIFHTFNWRK